MLKNNKQIIMQPMTHFEDLRAFLCDNGYKITKETVVREGKRLYLALSAEYTEEEADFWRVVLLCRKSDLRQ